MDKRLVLKNVVMEPSYGSAEATVELTLDNREAVGHHAGAAAAADNNLAVVGEATLKAVTKFLPSDTGFTLEKIMKAPDVIYAKVNFRSRKESHPLWGIAPVGEDISESVAKAILSAINRRSSMVFAN